MVSDVQIEPLWRALGKERAKALPAFHAFTGADNTGRIFRIGKATWLKVCLKADEYSVKLWSQCDWRNAVSPGIHVQLTHPRGSTSRQSLNCDGISSANIWQKVTSSLQHLELWSSTSWESMSKQQYGHRQPLLCRIYSWILCKMDTTLGWHAQTSEQRSSLLKPVILELVQCSANLTAPLGGAPAELRTVLCQFSSQCHNDDHSQAVMYESDDDD